MEKLIKENLVYILIVVIVVAAGIYFVITRTTAMVETFNVLNQKKEELTNKQAKLEKIRRAKAAAGAKKKETQSGKVIYEVLGQQFSSEASFGIMFENILSNITNSGVKIRSIDYNYAPQDDKVLSTNAQGYNACELYFVTVGNYSQFQTFFKNITKESYLTNIYEIYIEPYEKDKTILITKFKIRLYTKTI